MSTRNIEITDFDKRYNEKVKPEMEQEFRYGNVMAVPKIEKIVINAGIGGYSSDKKKLESIRRDLELLTGQRVVYTKAKNAIAGFGVREGATVGMRVTLRKKKMKEFFNRLAMISIPRIRDFQGIKSKSFDDKGNLSYGLREHIIFPEIKPEESLANFGLQINISTTAKNKEESIRLLQLMGLPIK